MIITVFGGIFGLVQNDQEDYSHRIWTLPVGIILLSTAFIVSKLEQGKGRDQMLHLVSLFYHSLSQIGPMERYE